MKLTRLANRNNFNILYIVVFLNTALLCKPELGGGRLSGEPQASDD